MLLFRPLNPMPFFDDLRRATIVIVEDHPDTRTTLTNFLNRQGAGVIAAGNAADGLQAVIEHHPHVVLCDLGLPDGNGFDLLKKIKVLDSDTHKTRVIAMTAMGNIVQREKAIIAGFDEFLRKPFGPDELLRCLESVVR
jgi:DNA-binding response OmpR family regulator